MKKKMMTFALVAMAAAFSGTAMADESWYSSQQIGGASSTSGNTPVFSAGASLGGSSTGIVSGINTSVGGATGYLIAGNGIGALEAQSVTSGQAKASANSIFVTSTSGVGLSSSGFECCSPVGGTLSVGTSSANAGNGISGTAGSNAFAGF